MSFRAFVVASLFFLAGCAAGRDAQGPRRSTTDTPGALESLHCESDAKALATPVSYRDELACGDILALSGDPSGAVARWKRAFERATSTDQRCEALDRIRTDGRYLVSANSEFRNQCRERIEKASAAMPARAAE